LLDEIAGQQRAGREAAGLERIGHATYALRWLSEILGPDDERVVARWRDLGGGRRPGEQHDGGAETASEGAAGPEAEQISP
jgi:hypothetical protein